MSTDCLFSLEVFIQDIQNLKVTCGIPAVAFRFLDYPTLLVYFTDIKNIDDIRKKVEYNHSTIGEVRNTEQLAALRNSLNGYNFHKGKSCLFRRDFGDLKNALAEIPLYVTVVDCLEKNRPKTHPKLLGVFSVSILSLLEHIENAREGLFQDSPAIAFEKYSTNILNLMGSCIGSMNFTVKITCYGSSLLRHVTVEEKRDSHINILLRNLTIENDIDSKVDDDDDGKKECKQSQSPPPSRVILPASGTEKPTNCVKNESCQTQTQNQRSYTDEKKWKMRRKEIKIEGEEIVIEHDNTFYPPPLFLNLKPDEKYLRECNNNSNTTKLSQFLTETKFQEYDELSEDEEPLREMLVPVKGQRSVYQIESDRANVFCHKPKEHAPTNVTVDKKCSSVKEFKKTMPILCTLVSEIAKFNELLNRKSEEGHDELKKNAQTNPEHVMPSSTPFSSPRRRGDISAHFKSHLRTSEILNESFLMGRVYSPRDPKDSRENEDQQKEQRPKKKKIKKKVKGISYGLTRTQRLRYALTHQGEMLKCDHDSSSSPPIVPAVVLDDEKVEDVLLENGLLLLIC